MKALYRKIVKVLHPDVNPDITKEENDMLIEATTAYKEGDLETLRKIAAMIDSGSIGSAEAATEQVSIERLREIVEELKRCVTALQMEIYGIKTSFPYNMKEFLADEQAMEEFLESDSLSDGTIFRLVNHRLAFPVFSGAALKNQGVNILMNRFF